MVFFSINNNWEKYVLVPISKPVGIGAHLIPILMYLSNKWYHNTTNFLKFCPGFWFWCDAPPPPHSTPRIFSGLLMGTQ